MKKIKWYLFQFYNGRVRAVRIPGSKSLRIYRKFRQVTNARNRRITRYLMKRGLGEV